MQSKLKNYSLTLDQYYTEDLKDEIKTSKKARSLSEYVNLLLKKDFEERKGSQVKPVGNLGLWLKKYPKQPKQKFVQRSNKEIFNSIYDDKLGR
jgi:hypothetical protein